MKVLIIIGAGASYDCWRPDLKDKKVSRLCLAKDLFSTKEDPQEKLLNRYQMMGLADELDELISERGKKFDLESELEKIQERAITDDDEDILADLFKARYYIQNLITDLQKRTIELTQGRTAYVRLLRKLKKWINEDPESRTVEIINFNYDCLVEEAMKQVYGSTWASKTATSTIEGYYKGESIRLYKPHGSINWGRGLLNNGTKQSYAKIEDIFPFMTSYTLNESFKSIEPTSFSFGDSVTKSTAPAIAVPFKTKSNFDECPPKMLVRMKKAISESDRLVTFGWRGGEARLVKLLEKNDKFKSVYIVSPHGDSELEAFAKRLYEVKFSDFMYGTDASQSIDHLLNALPTQP